MVFRRVFRRTIKRFIGRQGGAVKLSTMMFCVIITLLIATAGAILSPVIQPIRIFCPSQYDVNFNNSCISEFNNLDGYSQVLQSTDPNRVSRSLTVNSMGLTTARFLPEIVSTVCVENGSSPIDNLTNTLSQF